MSDAPDIEKTRVASLATRKFELLDLINADPACRRIPGALKLIQAYLRFLTDLEAPVYRSILDLRVDTALGGKAIIDTRRKLVALGYLVPVGRTASGVDCFRLGFTRENMVLDHINIARETLREVDTSRKLKQRETRQHARVSSAVEVTEHSVSSTIERPETSVSSIVEGTDPLCDFDHRTPVSSTIECNYVDKYVEESLSEQESKASLHARENPVPIPVDDDPALAALRRSAALFGGGS